MATTANNLKISHTVANESAITAEDAAERYFRLLEMISEADNAGCTFTDLATDAEIAEYFIAFRKACEESDRSINDFNSSVEALRRMGYTGSEILGDKVLVLAENDELRSYIASGLISTRADFEDVVASVKKPISSMKNLRRR